MNYELGRAVAAAAVPYLRKAITPEHLFEVTVSATRVEIRYGVMTIDEGLVHRLAVIDPMTSRVLFDHKIGVEQ